MAKPSQKRQKIDFNNTNVDNSSSNNNVKVISTTKGKRVRRSLPRDSPSQRSSVYRGVTRHRWTGRFEAHLWDKDCYVDSQKKKGRQVYLGAYDDEEAAARAYDLAALKYWGKQTILNFPVSNYGKELEEMEVVSREEYIGSLRRKSSGFSRGISKYRGVARHHHNGRWEARIGKVNGNKYLYLGTFATQEEAATAYDIAAIEHRGPNAVTNFDLSRYINLIKPNNNINDKNNNLCDDQRSPNQYEPTKSIEASGSSTSSSPITSLSDHTFEPIFDQLDENDICIDENMLWSEQLLAECPLMLLGFGDYNLLQCHSAADLTIDHIPCPILEGQSSSPNEFGSGEDGFFSELSSFLCDFDEE